MRPRYFWDTPNRVNAHPTDVVSESGPAFEHRILGSAPEAQDIVQDVWLRWRSTDRSAVLDPRQPEVELFRCQVDGKRATRRFEVAGVFVAIPTNVSELLNWST